MADGSFGFLSGTTVTAVPDISKKVESLAPLAVTLGPDRDAAAVLSAAGVSFVLAARADPLPVDLRQGLIAPGLDPEGFLWSIPADGGGGGLLAFGADNVSHQIPLALPSGARVVSLDLSRDGSRLLLALQTPEGPQLVVWGIVRDNSLAPVGLGDEPLAIAVNEAPIIDATWVDGVTVAVLSQAGDTSAVDLYQLGGTTTPRGSVAGGIGIVGGNGHRRHPDHRRGGSPLSSRRAVAGGSRPRRPSPSSPPSSSVLPERLGSPVAVAARSTIGG